MMPLDDLRMRNTDGQQTSTMGIMGGSKKSGFSLVNALGNIFRDWKSLDLVCETPDEAEFWKASFLRVGAVIVFCAATRNVGTLRGRVRVSRGART